MRTPVVGLSSTTTKRLTARCSKRMLTELFKEAHSMLYDLTFMLVVYAKKTRYAFAFISLLSRSAEG